MVHWRFILFSHFIICHFSLLWEIHRSYCLLWDALICIELDFDVAYFNQLKVRTCLLHSIRRRDFEQGFCLCLRISFFIWSIGSRWSHLHPFSGGVSLVSQIRCDVHALPNFSIGDLCSSLRSLNTFTLVFLRSPWEQGPNFIHRLQLVSSMAGTCFDWEFGFSGERNAAHTNLYKHQQVSV